MSDKFNIKGFPTVIVLDANGKELKKMVGYDDLKAKAFVAELKKLKGASGT